jgi:uncharacterized GH25 family protein
MRKRVSLVLLLLAGGFLLLWLVRSLKLGSSIPSSAVVTSGPASSSQETAEKLDQAQVSRETLALKQMREPVSALGPASSQGATLLVHLIKGRSSEPVADGVIRASTQPPAAGAGGPDEPQPERVLCAQGTTDEQGLTELGVPAAADLQVSVESKGDPEALRDDEPTFMPRTVEVGALGSGERRSLTIDVVFGRQIVFWGKAVSVEDRRPIAGARVWRWFASRNGSDMVELLQAHQHPSAEFVETDQDGMFVLHSTHWSINDMCIEARGLGPMLFQAGRGHDRREDPLVLKLGATAELQVRVIDPGGGGQHELSVWISTPSYALGPMDDIEEDVYQEPGPFWWSTCDADGRCVLRNLPSRVPLGVEIRRDRTMVLKLSWDRLERLALDPGEVRTVEWRIGVGTLVRGQALKERGQPVTGHEVWLLRETIAAVLQPFDTCMLIPSDEDQVVGRATTDEQGRFSFTEVQTGRWWVGLAPSEESETSDEEHRVAPLAVRFDIPEGATVQEVAIRPRTTLFIRGRVLAPDGQPMNEAAVSFGRKGTPAIHEAHPDKNGEFTIGPLEEGEWNLKASARFMHADSDEVVAKAGDSGVVLRLKAAGSLSGTVIASETGSGAVAKLVVGPSGDEKGAFQTGCGQDGRFEFVGLAPGDYDIFARASGDWVGLRRGIRVEPNVETRGVTIDLVRGARLTIRYQGQLEGASLRLLGGGASLGWSYVAKGSWTTVTVPAGTVTIHYYATKEGEKQVQTRVDAETEVVLDDP